MISGLILRKKLHLQNFSSVRIRRLAIPGSVRTYQIVFNSRFPDLPLTSYTLNTKSLMPKVVDGDTKKYQATPWADLDNFSGMLNPAVFFVTDLAGFYGIENNYSERCISIDNGRLKEITIPELRKVNMYTSSLTQKYKDLRLQYQGQGVKNTKLLDSKIIEESGSLQYIFLTESTEEKPIGADKHKVGNEYKKQYDLSSEELINNNSKTYDMILQLDNVFPNKQNAMSWLEVYDGELIDRRMMKELLDVADIKIWDNTPAFQYQGFRYRLTQIQASLYPETIPDSFWGSKHGDKAYLDKHWSQLFDRGTLDIFLNQMLSILIKYCKQLDYAKLGNGKGNYKIEIKKENR